MYKIRKVIIILLTVMITGCASTTNDDDVESSDPYESFNRAAYGFNSAIDKAVLRPAAVGYDTILPTPLKIGISNFFSNLDEIPTFANNLLQGKIKDALSDSGRFLINTTLGLAGFIDVASDLGFEQHDEDFGQTLGYWGVTEGPYFVLPLLGPSTVRDLLGKPLDGYYSLQQTVDHTSTKNIIYGINLLDLRYRLLAIDSQLEDALDEYAFVRDAYLMRRKYQVYDGNPPEEDDMYDDCGVDNEFCEDDIID
jgi:phospholipid-binding lipoprotein MlaA